MRIRPFFQLTAFFVTGVDCSYDVCRCLPFIVNGLGVPIVPAVSSK